jgi:hypothetical protein
METSSSCANQTLKTKIGSSLNYHKKNFSMWPMQVADNSSAHYLKGTIKFDVSSIAETLRLKLVWRRSFARNGKLFMYRYLVVGRTFPC